jgi:hypothetical protein
MPALDRAVVRVLGFGVRRRLHLHLHVDIDIDIDIESAEDSPRSRRRSAGPAWKAARPISSSHLAGALPDGGWLCAPPG